MDPVTSDKSDKTDLRTHVSSDDVRARGKALYDKTPPSAHDHAAAGAQRPGVLEYLEASNAGRLAHLIPLRIGRMLASPFSFYRGAAGLMAADLAGTPASGLSAQLCGDAHAANFGLYGTSDGDIVMDINDFDETVPGPWEWDLKRLAASLVLAGREAGMPDKKCLDAAEDTVKSYRRTVRAMAELPFLQSWNALHDVSLVGKAKADELIDDFERAAAKARKNTSAKIAAKRTEEFEHASGIRRLRFVADPPVRTPVDDRTEDAVIAALESYVDTLRESRRNLIKRYSVSDVAFRIVGTGSVGRRGYVALLHGNDDEVLILQLKEAGPSALEPYLDVPPVEHHGKRIVDATRLVQSESDILLGWTTVDGRPFIVRQFRNMKGTIDPDELPADHLDDYGRLTGALLARAHTRSIDPRLLAGYFADDNVMDEVVGRYAIRYADQTESDYEQLVAAVNSGKLEAETES